MLQGDKATEHRSLSPLDRAPGRSDVPDSLQLQVAQMREMLKSLVHDMTDVKGKLVSVKVDEDSDVMKDVKGKPSSVNDDKHSDASRAASH